MGVKTMDKTETQEFSRIFENLMSSSRSNHDERSVQEMILLTDIQSMVMAGLMMWLVNTKLTHKEREDFIRVALRKIKQKLIGEYDQYMPKSTVTDKEQFENKLNEYLVKADKRLNQVLLEIIRET